MFTIILVAGMATAIYLSKLGYSTVWQFYLHLEGKAVLYSIIGNRDVKGYVEPLVEVHWCRPGDSLGLGM